MPLRSFLSATIMALGLLFPATASAQIMEPAKWVFSQEKVSDNIHDLLFTVTIDDTWSIYGMDVPGGGPIPTSIEFEAAEGFVFEGKLQAPEATVKFDPNFGMDIPMYSGQVTFRQRVQVVATEPVYVRGEVSFMACDDQHCIPPDFIPFSFALPPASTPVDSPVTTAPEDEVEAEIEIREHTRKEIPTEKIERAEPLPEEELTEEADEPADAEEDPGTLPADEPATDTRDFIPPTEEAETRGLGRTFILGILGGLLGLLTPCVFPMIPLTVSFFLRNADNRARAVRDALLYGFTIVFSYVVIGLAISMIFGAAALNALATSPAFNIFFFALLVFFSASFFGAFELTLPSKWSTRLDNKADQTGGFIGVLLMGFTFVLVSFSCTGPIVGTLLVESATGGGGFAPAMGMLGFSLALAIPFSLFALFPAALKSLPKSGGWMTSVKVVLGFIVLAFALKFLSVADAVAQWGILDREVFLVLWIAIFLMMGLYLIGKIRFAHDSELTHLSVPRLALAIVTFAFVFYLIPGLWGAPLKAVSSFLPSPVTQDFDLSRITMAPASGQESQTIYVGESVREGPHGLWAFTDYEEGMEAARRTGKPVFLDFTGFGCANCRKMEATVWSDPQVLDRLGNRFIKISLYVDDRSRLPESEQFMSSALGRERRIVTVGQKWSAFQAERYGANTQPYYVILDHQEQMLAPAYGYDASIPRFIEWLDSGLNAF